jgi:hypothetical protein
MNIIIINHKMVIVGPSALETKEELVFFLKLYTPIDSRATDEGIDIYFNGIKQNPRYSLEWGNVGAIYDFFYTYMLGKHTAGYEIYKIAR